VQTQAGSPASFQGFLCSRPRRPRPGMKKGPSEVREHNGYEGFNSFAPFYFFFRDKDGP
jgi:hypothetical protein